MRLDRRGFLRGTIAFAAAGVAAPSLAHAAQKDHPKLLAIARAMLERHARQVKKSDIVGLADFSAPSWLPRFHLVDPAAGTVASHLTAHGRGSDPAHTGWLKSFSNEFGSNATSEGAYLVGGQYDGKYGRAIRLAGLDPHNANAEARAIVIHQAWYVSAGMIEKYGKLGRSEGCFALSETGIQAALTALGPGRLLYAGKFDEFGS